MQSTRVSNWCRNSTIAPHSWCKPLNFHPKIAKKLWFRGAEGLIISFTWNLCLVFSFLFPQ